MGVEELKAELGGIDIYLLDQVMKNRYESTDAILDAGCGDGRNLIWFMRNGFDIQGVDASAEAIASLRNTASSLGISDGDRRFLTATVESLPLGDEMYDHVICNAVLHFASNPDHFMSMFSALWRVLRIGGTLFIRMTSDFGIESKVRHIGHGVYQIPDGSQRFLLTTSLLDQLQFQFKFSWIEPLKTVNVDDLRCMSTLVLRK
jgi:tellurite methyltransferase